MNTEMIKARISIGKTEQGDIAFIYDFNFLKTFNVKHDDFFIRQTFLDVGTVFELNEQHYKISEIRTVFYDEMHSYGNGEQFDYNFEIMLFVEEVD